MQKERPTGVTVIAVLTIISSVFGIIAGLGGLAIGGVATTAGAADPSAQAVGGGLAILAIILLVVSALDLVCAIGLFRMASWGLWGTIILSVVGIVVAVANGGSILSVSNILGVIIVGYLFTQREKFA